MGLRKELMAKPLLKKYELIDRIQMITGFYAERDKAMAALLFMTGCRIEELVKYIKERDLKRRELNRETKEYEHRPIIDREFIGNSIQKKQIEIDEERDIMKLYGIRTLKRRVAIEKTIPIVISKDRKLFEIFKVYYNSCTDEDYMFQITRQRAYKILSNVGLYLHYLRHCRATNLVVDYNLNAQELKQFFNWKDSKPADAYVHLNVDDLINKMKK